MKADFSAKSFLEYLNKTYHRLHKKYEDLFWISYMGDPSVDKAKDKALSEKYAFQADSKNLDKIKSLIPKADSKMGARLKLWQTFFEFYETPKEALSIKKDIDRLESKINKKRAERKEGYLDPKTKRLVGASENKMRAMMSTHSDEGVRKACFESMEELALTCVDEYVELISLRNRYALVLGYEDFYDFKLRREDGMTKKELFSLFDSIYKHTKYALDNIKKLEKKTPGITKPWNFGYKMSGDFTKEKGPYFGFDEALTRWGKSFQSLGIGFKGGVLNLDLLDRKRKWSNGFCHWPELVRYGGGKRVPGSSNFTCNVVYGQVGSSHNGYVTLFHEGGHAAHLLNSEEQDVCVNHEYPPCSMSWAETQSMFLDTLFSSIEWASRYAKNSSGEELPFDLFKREVEKLSFLRPLRLNGIIYVSSFEREIYESKNLTREKVFDIAKKNYRKFFARSEDSISALNVPHIYNWDSSASYHGYGLATLALNQWMDYFYKKFGYVVDNPRVGKEMIKVWELASTKKFADFVKIATGKKLGSSAYINNVTRSVGDILKIAKSRIARLKKVPMHSGPIDLNADIRMVSGKKEIANNKKSFEDMAEKYGRWLGQSSH